MENAKLDYIQLNWVQQQPKYSAPSEIKQNKFACMYASATTPFGDYIVGADVVINKDNKITPPILFDVIAPNKTIIAADVATQQEAQAIAQQHFNNAIDHSAIVTFDEPETQIIEGDLADRDVPETEKSAAQ